LDPQNFEAGLERLKDKFPRGGAMGILENDPDLVDNFTRFESLLLCNCVENKGKFFLQCR